MEPKTDFDFYLKFTKPLILNLPDLNDRALASAWVKKLLKDTAASEKIKLDYIKLLLFVLQRKKLAPPFTQHPNKVEVLEEFPENQTLVEVAKSIIEKEDEENRAKAQKRLQKESGDFPPYLSDFSADLLEYAAVQSIENGGIHGYYALSKEPLSHWDRVDKQVLPKAAKSMIDVSGGPATLTGTLSTPQFVKSKPSVPPTEEVAQESPDEPPAQEEPPEGAQPEEAAPAEEGATQKKAPKKKSNLGSSPPSRPIGRILPPEEDREPPSWGSNLLEVKRILKEMEEEEYEAEILWTPSTECPQDTTWTSAVSLPHSKPGKSSTSPKKRFSKSIRGKQSQEKSTASRSPQRPVCSKLPPYNNESRSSIKQKTTEPSSQPDPSPKSKTSKKKVCDWEEVEEEGIIKHDTTNVPLKALNCGREHELGDECDCDDFDLGTIETDPEFEEYNRFIDSLNQSFAQQLQEIPDPELEPEEPQELNQPPAQSSHRTPPRPCPIHPIPASHAERVNLDQSIHISPEARQILEEAEYSSNTARTERAMPESRRCRIPCPRGGDASRRDTTRPPCPTHDLSQTRNQVETFTQELAAALPGMSGVPVTVPRSPPSPRRTIPSPLELGEATNYTTPSPCAAATTAPVCPPAPKITVQRPCPLPGTPQRQSGNRRSACDQMYRSMCQTDDPSLFEFADQESPISAEQPPESPPHSCELYEGFRQLLRTPLPPPRSPYRTPIRPPRICPVQESTAEYLTDEELAIREAIQNAPYQRERRPIAICDQGQMRNIQRQSACPQLSTIRERTEASTAYNETPTRKKELQKRLVKRRLDYGDPEKGVVDISKVETFVRRSPPSSSSRPSSPPQSPGLPDRSGSLIRDESCPFSDLTPSTPDRSGAGRSPFLPDRSGSLIRDESCPFSDSTPSTPQRRRERLISQESPPFDCMSPFSPDQSGPLIQDESCPISDTTPTTPDRCGNLFMSQESPPSGLSGVSMSPKTPPCPRYRDAADVEREAERQYTELCGGSPRGVKKIFVRAKKITPEHVIESTKRYEEPIPDIEDPRILSAPYRPTQGTPAPLPQPPPNMRTAEDVYAAAAAQYASLPSPKAQSSSPKANLRELAKSPEIVKRTITKTQETRPDGSVCEKVEEQTEPLNNCDLREIEELAREQENFEQLENELDEDAAAAECAAEQEESPGEAWGYDREALEELGLTEADLRDIEAGDFEGIDDYIEESDQQEDCIPGDPWADRLLDEELDDYDTMLQAMEAQTLAEIAQLEKAQYGTSARCPSPPRGPMPSQRRQSPCSPASSGSPFSPDTFRRTIQEHPCEWVSAGPKDTIRVGTCTTKPLERSRRPSVPTVAEGRTLPQKRGRPVPSTNRTTTICRPPPPPPQQGRTCPPQIPRPCPQTSRRACPPHQPAQQSTLRAPQSARCPSASRLPQLSRPSTSRGNVSRCPARAASQPPRRCPK